MDTEKLKELLAAATPGPWSLGGPEGDGEGQSGYIYCDNNLGSAVAIVFGGPLKFSVFSRAEEVANAALICAAVNALPSLLAELESAREIIEAQSSDVILARESIEGPAMSADELLPLPDFPNQLEFPHTDSWMRQAIRDYATTTARANVAHATAGLRAEVEALKLENETWHGVHKMLCETLDCVGYSELEAASKLVAELAAAREYAARLLGERNEMAQFIRKTLTDGPFQGFDVDGGGYQDEAEARGFLRRVDVTEPCGENCSCAEFGLPTYCLRFTEKIADAAMQEQK